MIGWDSPDEVVQVAGRVYGGNHHPGSISPSCENYPASSGHQSGTGFDPALGFGSIDDREKGFIGGVRDFMDKKITDFIDERIVVCEILL
ncbi:hypothetical protein F2Q69_00030801 [Brassica cretica]|uniref:Uncharacterized protein n=1 Tax=Brassica cretica TaxID=69181 RepID=A0A8S9S1Y2_BRACR|nr:hypothetical protein F2Q69_00030801 [Brassica cretica]